ncbi:MAG: tyrosine-type recombinase/integrase [Alphaproteobacteria bacterium]|nr:MAG: tyrosine-type recombinase/integrase [Alphaproteobacteria bacterium]
MMRSEKGLSKNTVEAYERDLKHFLSSWRSPKGAVAIHNGSPQDFVPRDDVLLTLTEDQIRQYLNALTINSRSIARKISALKQFYMFLMRQKLIQKNPMDNISSPKIKPPFPKTLTKEEVEILLKAAADKDFRLSTMLEILYATGLRISELISLKTSNFSYYDDHPILLIKGKGGRERIVPLGETSHKQLKEYLVDMTPSWRSPKGAVAIHNGSPRRSAPRDDGGGIRNTWMFPSFGASGHITRQRMGQLLKEIALSVNIDPEKVSPHILRHAFATHMLQSGADLTLIKELLGHKNLSTSEIYLHVLPQDLKNLVEQYHPAKGLMISE